MWNWNSCMAGHGCITLRGSSENGLFSIKFSPGASVPGKPKCYACMSIYKRRMDCNKKVVPLFGT